VGVATGIANACSCLQSRHAAHRPRWPNFLFLWSEGTGNSAAIAYTLIETAKLNGVDPQAWLTDVLGRISDHMVHRIDELLPWRYAQDLCVAAQRHPRLGCFTRRSPQFGINNGSIIMENHSNNMKLAVFLAGDSNYHHMGWRHPDAAVDAGSNFDRWRQFAAVAEAAKMDMLFIADTITIVGSDNLSAIANSAKVHRFEPLTLLSALATCTSQIGLVATCATSYSQPYNVARMFGSLDHLCGGRAGWNCVTGGQLEDAPNFNLDRHDAHADRYERAEEFADVVMGLWSSFEEDALIRNKETGQFFDPAKVHHLNHKGKYFSVKGPLNVTRSPQGRPIIIQADGSEATINMAARIADVVFTGQADFDAAREFYGKVKEKAAQYGRTPDSIKVMPGISMYVGDTRQEAQAKFDQLHDMVDVQDAMDTLSRFMGGIDLSEFDLDGPMPDLGGNDLRMSSPGTFARIGREQGLSLAQVAVRAKASRNHCLVVGDVSDVCDVMEHWFRNGAADGFNLLPAIMPGSLEDFTQLVIPELQTRGLFRREYEAETLRGNLGLPGL
jgi:FMN-dependent oxidoreductase (nitrilotriacetate monooxygenase family)